MAGTRIGAAFSAQETVTLNQLSDVVITSPVDNDLLAYDLASESWINQTPNQAGLDSRYLLLTGSLADVSNHSHTVLTNIGTNTHAQLDTFKDTTVPTTYAPLASPTFTGTVTIPTPFTIGAVSLTATATELNILDGGTLTTTELNYVDGVTSAIQTQLDTKAPSTSPTFATSITGSYLTASEILITNASKNIVSAAVATYPSLTELTYLKGVTSAIQTQLDGKASIALSNLASVAINTSLISDTDSTDNLGSTTKAWANLYVDTIKSITGNALALTPVDGQSLTVNLSTTGDFVVNTNQLVVDTSAGNVGIGSGDPASKLEIQGAGGSQEDILRLKSVATAATHGPFISFEGASGNSVTGAIGQEDDGVLGESDIVFRASNSGAKTSIATLNELVRFKHSGEVGIGETVPDYKLDVNGTFGFTPGTSVTPVDNGDVVIQATNNTTLTFKLKGTDAVVRSGTITLA